VRDAEAPRIRPALCRIFEPLAELTHEVDDAPAGGGVALKVTSVMQELPPPRTGRSG
jgi:hypothetical protein